MDEPIPASTFYTSVNRKSNFLLVCGYHEGKRFKDRVKYRPYLFLPSKTETTYRALDGQHVARKDFDTMGEANQFIRTYSDVENFETFGLENFVYPYIYDNYPGRIAYDPSLVKTWTIDIETACANGFPDIATADQEITAITIDINGKIITLGCGDFFTHDKSITYVRFKDETALLKGLIGLFSNDAYRPDVITGWWIRFFDIPYIINRIARILGPDEVKKVSPWEIIEEDIIKIGTKELQTYVIMGVSILDYQELYKKFTYQEQESYSLDHIAQVETGKRKLDYSEYASLQDLYEKNYQKFIEYNIEDVRRVIDIDAKKKLLNLVYAIAYDAKINLVDALTSVRLWDVIIHNYLMDQGKVVPKKKKKPDDRHVPGGFVKEPHLGMNHWVVSFDLTSLYPHLIKQYNISPETFVTSRSVPLEDYVVADLDRHMERLKGPLAYAQENNLSLAANGCMFTKEYQGFLPALMGLMFKRRKDFKDKMLMHEKELQKIIIEMDKRGIHHD